MMAISIDLESVRFTRPGGRPRGSLAEHDARKPRFFRKRFLEKHIPRLGIYRLAGFVDFKRLPDRSLQVLTGCVTQAAIVGDFERQLEDRGCVEAARRRLAQAASLDERAAVDSLVGVQV